MIRKTAGPRTAAWSGFAGKSGSWAGSWAGFWAESSCWASRRSWSGCWGNRL